MATLSITCVTLVIILVGYSLSANVIPNGGVAEDPNPNAAAPAMTLGTIRTLNLAQPREESVCDWNTRITQFLLDETKDRVELKFTLEQKINELYEQIEQLKSLFVKDEEASVSVPSRQKTASWGDAVAFSAEVGSHLTGLTRDQTIVFSSPRTNLGNAYDSETGVFTCPTAGLYLFTATVLSNLGDRIETEIVLRKAEGDVNQESVAKLYSGASSQERYGSGSNTVVLELEEGDKVWVRVYNGLGSFIYQQWSSFSGVLIQRR